MAKRSKQKWFIGAITNSTGRSIDLNLDFLADGKSWQLNAFEDGVNADVQAMDYKKVSREVKTGETIRLVLARDGGWAAVIE